jgi:hypothetical protein
MKENRGWKEKITAMLLSCYHTYLNYKITLQRESFEKKYH